MLGAPRPGPGPGRAAPRAPAPSARKAPLPSGAALGLRTSAATVPRARALGGTEQLREVRRGHEAEAVRLGAVRSEAALHQHGREEERAHALLRQALHRELGPPEPRAAPPPPVPAGGAAPEPTAGPAGLPPAPGAAGAQPAPGAPRGVDTEALLALVERIETFVRAQRPALALTLEGSLAARVELERTGPGEVAVTLVGRRAGVRGGDLERLRAAVQARGLRLCRLVVAGTGEPSAPA